MSSQRRRPMRFGVGWVLGAGLAMAVAPMATADAGPLCLATGTVFSPLVLSKAKLKKGKVNPVVGYTLAGNAANPVGGVSIVSADGMSLAIAVEAPRVSVSSGGGGGASASETTFRAFFVEPDGSLDVGDTSSQGVVGGANVTFTVIACNSAPAIP